MDSRNDFDSLKNLKGFKVVHLNIRSIVKKIDQIRLLLQDTPTDILTVSETWLRPHLNTELVEIEGYKIYRLDRTCNGTSKKKRGGAW